MVIFKLLISLYNCWTHPVWKSSLFIKSSKLLTQLLLTIHLPINNDGYYKVLRKCSNSSKSGMKNSFSAVFQASCCFHIMQKYKLFMGKNMFADKLVCWYVFTHEHEWRLLCNIQYSGQYSPTVAMLKTSEHITHACIANKHNIHVQIHSKSIKTQIMWKHIFLYTVPLQYQWRLTVWV